MELDDFWANFRYNVNHNSVVGIILPIGVVIVCFLAYVLDTSFYHDLIFSSNDVSFSNRAEFFQSLRDVIFGMVLGLVVLSITLSPIVYAVKARNIFIAAEENLTTREHNLTESIARKSKLNAQLVSVANSLSDVEKSTHTTITGDIANAAKEMSNTPYPTIVLANLAANFPTLSSNVSFVNVQKKRARN